MDKSNDRTKYFTDLSSNFLGPKFVFNFPLILSLLCNLDQIGNGCSEQDLAILYN